MSQRNPFEVLGVTPRVERAVIRAAYRALAKIYHPDAQRGMTPEESGRRMAELNWAWEELERDLEGWRLRAGSDGGVQPAQASPSAQPAEPQSEPFDQDAYWRRHTEQYRRPRGDIRGWRAWVGSDVLCRECGCALSTWVYKCPDCGQTKTWKMSKLARAVQWLGPLFTVFMYVTMLPLAILFFGALLMVPPLLVLDIVGLAEEGGVWEWSTTGQVLFGVGYAVEIGLIFGRKQIAVAWKKLDIG